MTLLRSIDVSLETLETLEKSELAGAPEMVRRAIRVAHELARDNVKYRFDGNLGKADLEQRPVALSCSELVYYAYAKSGLDLGEEHARTRLLAFANPPPYAPSMARVFDGDGSIRAGDLLVYHRDRELVEREIADRGRSLPGHVVIAVSVEQRIVIGSHGRGSTPEGSVRGVGYRVLSEGWGEWTKGRTLRAIYRLATSD